MLNKYDFKELTSVRPLDSYSKEQINNIKLMSVTKDKNIFPFGSASYRIQKYPGDLDLFELYENDVSIDDLIINFSKELYRVVINIINEPYHSVVEIKCGLDERYDIKNIGIINNGIFKPNYNEIVKKMNYLIDNKLLTKNETYIISYILSKQKLNGDDYDVLNFIFRERKIIRWNYKEFLNGYKILPGNKKMTLHEALKYKSAIKIDVITNINNKFVEVTNYFVLIYNDNGNLIPVNLDYNFLNLDERFKKYNENMRNEIEKLYYSNMYYNPFKMMKRMWAMSRYNYNITSNNYYKNALIKLTPYISQNISFLYQIKSEIDAIIRLLLEGNFKPYRDINKELEIMKVRLSTQILINDHNLQILIDMIDNFEVSNNVEQLENIKKFISKIINYYSIISLDELQFIPIPKNFLPKKIKYETIIRSPDEIIVNPLKTYSDLLH